MLKHPTRRTSRLTSAAVLVMLLATLVAPVPSLAQPVAAEPASAAALALPAVECDPGGDTTGEEPQGVHTISGTVRNLAGAPIPDVRIRAQQEAGEGATLARGETHTNAVGDYVLTGLSAVPYVLSFSHSTGSYQMGYLGSAGLVPAKSAALPVDAGPNPTGVNVALPAERPSTVTGRITDATGQPVPGVFVRAGSPELPIVGCGFTQADGTYEMSDVRVGEYRISVQDESGAHPNGYYTSVAPHFTSSYSDSTLLTIDASRADLNIQFPRTYTLSGTVQTAGGAGVDGISVIACEVEENGWCSSGASADGGSFTIPTLVAGSYVIQQHDSTFTYTSGYHVPGGVVADRADAAVIAVAANVIDVGLRAVPNPQISGIVTNAEARPLTGIDVQACALPDAFECSYATTDGGTYTMGVNPGDYEIRFLDPSGDHPSGYLGAGNALVTSQADAATITVGSSGATASIALPDGGRVSGTLTTGGFPTPWINFAICVSEENCLAEGYSAEDGTFTAPAVLPGTYLLGAFTEDGTRVWYVDGGAATTDVSLATPLTVTTAGVTGITFDVPAAAPVATTPEGEFVEVLPVDPNTGQAPVGLTFDNVTIAGETTLTVSESGPAAPTGFQLGLPPTYYDISTTATFAGEVTICISYVGVSFTDEATLRLYHYDSVVGWEDTTTSHDMDSDVICGRTDSFSPFAIVQRSMAFGGFEAPVDDLPTPNRAKAGSAIPVTFSLGGDFGLDVLAAGSPTSRSTGCNATVASDPIETTTTGASQLSYDAATDLYTYAWKTSKSWAGTCRQLTLTFSDGSTAEALFEFKR